MEQYEFHDGVAYQGREWVEIEPGIHQLILNKDPATGRRTVLQRWQPNTKNVQQNFVHDYVEEIYIVEGDFRDTKRNLGPWYKGAYAYRKPGMEHGPFASDSGVLMYITCTPVSK